MGCRDQVHGPGGEPWCEPENRRCIEVPLWRCGELRKKEKEEASE